MHLDVSPRCREVGHEDVGQVTTQAVEWRSVAVSAFDKRYRNVRHDATSGDVSERQRRDVSPVLKGECDLQIRQEMY